MGHLGGGCVQGIVESATTDRLDVDHKGPLTSTGNIESYHVGPELAFRHLVPTYATYILMRTPFKSQIPAIELKRKSRRPTGLMSKTARHSV